MDNVRIWNGKVMALVRVGGVPVPQTRLVAAGSMANSFIFRISGDSIPIAISHLDLDGGMSADGLDARLVMGEHRPVRLQEGAGGPLQDTEALEARHLLRRGLR